MNGACADTGPVRRLAFVRAIAWPLLCIVLSGCHPSVLVVRAPKTKLGVGESTQLTASEGALWFVGMHALEPRSLTWRTTGASCLVPEPDGRVTCVGTNGREYESAIISAASGSRRGWLRFHVTRAGPGPSLAFVTRGSTSPCTEWPNERCTTVREGESVRFRIRKLGPGSPDVTARSAGTQYLVFIGSGLANDPAPERVIGEPWPPKLNASSVRIDDVSGVIAAPDSIGTLNWLAVIIFARHNDSVGWLFLRIEHRVRA